VVVVGKGSGSPQARERKIRNKFREKLFFFSWTEILFGVGRFSSSSPLCIGIKR